MNEVFAFLIGSWIGLSIGFILGIFFIAYREGWLNANK
jgi:hypothetical protein